MTVHSGHTCTQTDLAELRLDYSRDSRIGEYAITESCGVFRCLACGQFWMVRFRTERCESGHVKRDDLWIRPGQRNGLYHFPLEDARV